MQFIQFLQSSVPHIRSEIHYIVMICQEQFLLLLMLKTKSCFIFFLERNPILWMVVFII